MQTARVRPALHAAPAVLPLPGGQDGATVTLQPLLCGEMLGPAGWFEAEPGLAGALRALGVRVPKHELIRVPIVAFLIEHPTAGPILIDTGFHRAIADGTSAQRNRNLGPIGRWMIRNVEMRAEQTAAEQLRARGIEPREVGPDRDDAPALRPCERAGGLPRRHGAGLRAGVARGERTGEQRCRATPPPSWTRA